MIKMISLLGFSALIFSGNVTLAQYTLKSQKSQLFGQKQLPLSLAISKMPAYWVMNHALAGGCELLSGQGGEETDAVLGASLGKFRPYDLG